MGLRERAITAGLAGAVCLLVACSAPATQRTGTEPPPSSTPTSSVPATTTATTEYAVEPPGPRRDRLWSADLLVFDRATLSDEMVARVKALPGVQAVERLSMAQAVVEGEALDVAAVDPATYRLFTERSSADTQAVWDRVAGGELAVVPGLRTRLPIDQRGYVALVEGAPRIHVGAFAPQVPYVDAVLNERWAEALGGFVEDNALLVSTGSAAPDTVRDRIQRVVPRSTSIQALDLAARLGLDPDVAQNAVVVGDIAQVVGRFTYRVLGGGRIAPDPQWVRTHIGTEVVPILGEVTCNKYLFPQLRAALLEIQQQGLASEIHPEEYAGCYYPRFIAGTTKLSNHSFGLALDLNVPGNGRGTPGEIHRGVVAIFKKWGFAWGGDWKWTDPMHFEMARLVHPG